MILKKARAGVALVALVSLGALGRAEAEAPAAAATPWVEAQGARVRLLAGADAGQRGKSFLAGLEIRMDPGWKTYWRNPGEAGVPPSFDWSGSKNTASIKVQYPAPVRLTDPAAEMIGYKTSVLFPIEVTPQTPSEAVDLRLALEFAVCREICIPAQAAIDLTVPPGLSAGAPDPRIAAAQERVPRSPGGARAGDPKLLAAAATLDGATPNLEVTATFPGGIAGADLFVDAPDGFFLPMAQKAPGDGAGVVRFRVDLTRDGSAAELKGKTLTLTLVSDAGASEVPWTVK